MQALAIAPVTPPASTPSATASPSGGNGFSKALDDAASRRADEQAASAKSPSADAKEPTPLADQDAGAPADDTTTTDPAEDASSPVDPLLWAQIPVRPELAAGRSAHKPGADDTASGPAPDVLAEDAAGAAERRLAGASARPVPGPTDAAPRAEPTPADAKAAETIPLVRDSGQPAATTAAPAGPLPLPGLPGLTQPAVPTASTAAAAAGATALPEAHVPVPLEHPGFGAAFGAQLSLLARDGVKQARLHLNPAELGPVQVQITVTGQIARVDLVAEQALTRQVLEQSMPSLASSLRESGLTLAGGGVFEQPRQADPEARDPQAGGTGRGAANADAELAASLAEHPVATGRPRGVVDLYA